jgi:Flp pilus assembly pilin Flp
VTAALDPTPNDFHPGGARHEAARLERQGEEVKRMNNFFAKLYLWTQREEGQTMAEYGVVLAVITVAIVATLGLLSGKINSALSAVIAAI